MKNYAVQILQQCKAAHTFRDCSIYCRNILDNSYRYYACNSEHPPLEQVYSDYSSCYWYQISINEGKPTADTRVTRT